MSLGKRDYLSRLQTLLLFFNLNDTAKTKLAIISFLYCGEIVKNRMLVNGGTFRIYKIG